MAGTSGHYQVSRQKMQEQSVNIANRTRRVEGSGRALSCRSDFGGILPHEPLNHINQESLVAGLALPYCEYLPAELFECLRISGVSLLILGQFITPKSPIRFWRFSDLATMTVPEASMHEDYLAVAR
jgi:hypothetical protein